MIVREGIRRMYEEREDLFYYLTLYNENYAQLAMPEGSEEGILKGIYLLKKADVAKPEKDTPAAPGQRIHSDRGAESPADSGGKIQRRSRSVERHQLQRTPSRGPQDRAVEPVASGRTGEEALYPGNPGKHGRARERRVPDYMKTVQDQIAPWVPGRYFALGTDGFGRSDNRQNICACTLKSTRPRIAGAALSRLSRDGKFDPKKAAKALVDLGIDTEKADAATA